METHHRSVHAASFALLALAILGVGRIVYSAPSSFFSRRS
jgi:hypothetical protein